MWDKDKGETKMNKKRIVSLAIWLALPFAANATDPVVAVGPAHASSNAVIATASAPYVTVTPSTADESHIATTAYVKGAYNDAIAAVNNVAGDVTTLTNNMDDKQDKLESEYTSDEMNTTVAGADTMSDIIAGYLSGTNGSGDLSNAAYTNLNNTTLASVGGVYAALSQTLSMEGVEIYTTWDDDSANATTQVSLTSAN